MGFFMQRRDDGGIPCLEEVENEAYPGVGAESPAEGCIDISIKTLIIWQTKIDWTHQHHSKFFVLSIA